MRLILVIIGLLSLCLPAICADPLLSDAAFDKIITVDYKGEALSDIVKVLSKQTELSIRTTSDTADQKVTILVDNMPVKDIMSGIATLFGWKWTIWTDGDKQTYLLYDPLRKEKDAIKQKALSDAWRNLYTKLVQLASDNRKTNSVDTTALMLYRTLSPKAKKEFLAGNQICFDSVSSNPNWLLPTDVSQAIVAAMSQYSSNDDDNGSQLYKSPDKCNICLSTTVSASKIEARASVAIHRMQDSSPNVGSSSISYPMLYTQKIEYPADTFKNILPQEPASDLLNKKATISKTDLMVEENSETGECSATRTDLFAALHNKLGLQIISDYYSSWGAFSGINEATLKQVLEGDTIGFPAYWGWDGKVLYLRVKDVWNADQREIPNRLLRPWQAAVKRQGYLGLDELAEISLLSGEQKQALFEDSERFGLGRYERNVMETEAALKFYGMLTSKQRKDIFAGMISPMELTTEQKSALSALIIDNLRGSMADRLGVYNKDGLSLDNPNLVCDDNGSPATSIRMDTNGLTRYSYKDSENNNCTISASTYEGAVAVLKQMKPSVDLNTLVPNSDINYKWIIQYQNMSESQGQITVKVVNKKPKRVKYKSS